MNVARVLRPAQKVLATALVAVLAAGGAAVVTPTTASATPVPTVSLVTTQAVAPAMSKSSYEYAVKYWVNHVRRAHHLRALPLASCTDAAGDRWSAHLAATDTLYHQSMTKLLYQCNVYYAGETLGRGAISPRTLVNMWMRSPEHHAILMSRQPNRIGIGATPDAHGQWVIAAEFMKYN